MFNYTSPIPLRLIMAFLSRKNTGSLIKSKQAQCRKGKAIIDMLHFLKISHYWRFGHIVCIFYSTNIASFNSTQIKMNYNKLYEI